MEKKTYTPKDIMEMNEMSQTAVYELFNRKDFPSFKSGGKYGKWLVDIKKYEKWMEKQEEKSYINYIQKSNILRRK